MPWRLSATYLVTHGYMYNASLQQCYLANAQIVRMLLLCSYVRICTDDDEALQPEWEIDPKDLQIMEKVSLRHNDTRRHHKPPATPAGSSPCSALRGTNFCDCSSPQSIFSSANNCPTCQVPLKNCCCCL